MQIEPKDETRLARAFTCHGSEIKTYDDGCGPLWIVRGVYGVRRIIRARSWEAAYEIHIDEEPPIEVGELWQAYGFDTPEAFEAAIAQARESGDWPDLIEGYQYQSNSTGTGIVSVDYDERLDPLCTEDIREGIRVELERL